MRQNQVAFDTLEIAIKEFDKQAKNWTDSFNFTNFNDPIATRMLNDQMMQIEKIFLSSNGLPFQNETRHIILASNSSSHYGSPTFPGIINLFERFVLSGMKTNIDRNKWEHWETLRRHVTEIYVKIMQAASHLKYFHVI